MKERLIQILERHAVIDGGPILRDEAESVMDAILGGLRCDRCEYYDPNAQDCIHVLGIIAPEPGDFCSHWKDKTRS